MSGFRDIDGTMVMCGSPGVAECIGISLCHMAGIPGKPNPYVGDRDLLYLIEASRTHAPDQTARLEKARELILEAALLLDPASTSAKLSASKGKR